jgi:hypothetical protein
MRWTGPGAHVGIDAGVDAAVDAGMGGRRRKQPIEEREERGG